MAIRIEFHKHGGPEVLQAVEFTPADPAENEIQVENKAIGINFIDTYIRSGLYPPPSLPSGLGTEAAGIVSKVGSGVKHIKAGDRVVYAQSALGAYSSVHNINADKAAILPAAISFEQAAASFLKESARGVRFSGQRHLGTVAGLPATPRLNGELWQLIRCGYRCELRHSQSERLVVCDTPFPARLYHHAGGINRGQ